MAQPVAYRWMWGKRQVGQWYPACHSIGREIPEISVENLLFDGMYHDYACRMSDGSLVIVRPKARG